MVERRIEIASPEDRLADLPLEDRAVKRVPSVAVGPCVRIERLSVARNRLGVARHPACLVASLEEVVLGAFPLLRRREVMSEDAGELVESIREQRLDRGRDVEMQFPATVDQDAVVRRLLDEGVGEQELQFRLLPALPDELELLETREVLVERGVGVVEGVEHAVQEAPPDDARDLQD